MTKGAGYGAGGPDQTTLQLQQRLQQLGFNIPTDGKYGPQTEMAVKAFQQKYGLDPSGGIDAATIEVMQNPPDETLAQVRAAKAAASRAASAAARKTATAAAKAKSTAATAKIRASAKTAAGKASGASAQSLGAANLTQGTGVTGKANTTVSNLQAALNQAGYKLTQDGRFGPQTEAAVKKLQEDHGLTADGIVGPATKALLIGLTKSAAKPRAASSRTKKIAGQPAVLRTQQPHPRHGSRTAGSRMQLKAPPPHAATLKYSASDLPDPDLEETEAFGYGGQPSRSIKDARPAPEPTPLVDQPVWDRTQKIANPPDYTIPDGRDIDQPQHTPPGDTTIPDGRSFDEVQTALKEAIAARQAARDGRTFARALARERTLRDMLLEAAGAYDEAKHPRGRGGRWMEVFAKLKKLPVNKPGEIHGMTAMRLSTGHYAAGDGRGFYVHHESAEHVTTAISNHLDQQDELAAHGQRALVDLSPEAAQHFTRDWSQRGDPEGAPERSEMYQQVHSEDPVGYVRGVFSQPMTPEHRAEADIALAAAKTRAQRNRVAPYFDLTKPHEMVSVDKLRPTKIDPESSYQNATKRMGAAARGEMNKRKPLTAQVGGDGRLLLVDGHATLEAAKREGITHVPVEIRPRATNLNPNTSKDAIREQYRLDKAAINVEAQLRRPKGRRPNPQSSSLRERGLAQVEAERRAGARKARPLMTGGVPAGTRFKSPGRNSRTAEVVGLSKSTPDSYAFKNVMAPGKPNERLSGNTYTIHKDVLHKAVRS